MRDTKKQKDSKYIQLANVFGTLGYCSILIQWAWSFLILFYPYIISGDGFFAPNISDQRPDISLNVSSPILIGVSLFITIVVLILAVITILNLPKNIGKQGSIVTHKVALAITPIVMRQHKPLPEKVRKKISFRLIILIKIFLILIPIVSLVLIEAKHVLPYEIIWIISIFCASWSIFYFLAQYIMVIFYKIRSADVL